MTLRRGCIFLTELPLLGVWGLLMAAVMASAGMQPASRFWRAWDTPNLTPSCSAASKGASTWKALGRSVTHASWSALPSLQPNQSALTQALQSNGLHVLHPACRQDIPSRRTHGLGQTITHVACTVRPGCDDVQSKIKTVPVLAYIKIFTQDSCAVLCGTSGVPVPTGLEREQTPPGRPATLDLCMIITNILARGTANQQAMRRCGESIRASHAEICCHTGSDTCHLHICLCLKWYA